MRPDLELITTGAELLNGSTLNRHARWLGSALGAMGWSLQRDTTVPDEAGAISDALRSALNRSDVVIITGGLGPTCDDLTRDVAAAWAGTGIEMHEPSRLRVVEAYQRRKKPLNSMVERHALVVKGARVLDNNYGLAPGEYLEKGGKHVFLLPGPPREFQGVMKDHVLPWIKSLGIGAGERRSVFQIAGLGESDIAATLENGGLGAMKVDVAYCAAPSRVTIRLHERAGEANAFDRAVALVRSELASSIYAETEATIEEMIVATLAAMKKTLAVAESCTGGMLGEKMTELPGVSSVFNGGVIAYHNAVKEHVLGVDGALLTTKGAVSREVAEAMAAGVRKVCRADYGLSITGIAGPDGGTPAKPVGLVFIGWSDGKTTGSHECRLGGGRETIREAAVFIALDLLRRQLELSKG